MAVLFRATRLSAQLSLELKRAKIPYVVVGGEDFFALAHIKAVLDLIRLLINSEDTIALSGLQDLINFSSSEALEKIEVQAEHNDMSIWKVAAHLRETANSTEEGSYKGLLNFGNHLLKLGMTVATGQSITPTVRQIVEYLSPYLKIKAGPNWKDVSEDLKVLLSVTEQFISLSDFIDTVSLEQFVDEEEVGEVKPLVLTTIHSAKGLEWDTVFVIGLVEFWFPLHYAIQQSGTDEEERRLFYVAVTRARQQLYLSHYKKSVNQYGRAFEQAVSRFIKELSPSTYQIISSLPLDVEQIRYKAAQLSQEYLQRSDIFVIPTFS